MDSLDYVYLEFIIRVLSYGLSLILLLGVFTKIFKLLTKMYGRGLCRVLLKTSKSLHTAVTRVWTPDWSESEDGPRFTHHSLLLWDHVSLCERYEVELEIKVLHTSLKFLSNCHNYFNMITRYQPDDFVFETFNFRFKILFIIIPEETSCIMWPRLVNIF